MHLVSLFIVYTYPFICSFLALVILGFWGWRFRTSMYITVADWLFANEAHNIWLERILYELLSKTR